MRTSVAFTVARWYLFAKKSQNVINIISAISAAGVMVATAALVIVLSVFNGLNGLVQGLFGSFDPDYLIVPKEGKSFVADSVMIDRLRGVEGVRAVSAEVMDNALVRYGKRQVPATVLGVDGEYGEVTDIDSIIIEGTFRAGQCCIGAILADQLGVSSNVFVPTVTFYAPKRVGKVNMANPEKSFVEHVLRVSGTFMVQQSDYDGKYILADIGMARDLFCYTDSDVTSIAVRGRLSEDGQKEVEAMLGGGVRVLDKWHQHESFFRMMQVEKLMSFLILLFIVIIAAFNIIGSLSMLIFEKKESIGVLRSMGAERGLVTRIFLYEGWLVSVGGALLGLVLGVLMVLAQEKWGIVGFGSGEDYIVSSYPVELMWSDVVLTFVSVIVLAVVAAYYPVRVIVRKYYEGRDS